MSAVTISEEAKELLRARMAASGLARPLAWIALNQPETHPRDDDDDADWTVRRRELWALDVRDGGRVADGDPRLAIVDGLGFVCDFFPMRFDISVRDGQFRVGAAA